MKEVRGTTLTSSALDIIQWSNLLELKLFDSVNFNVSILVKCKKKKCGYAHPQLTVISLAQAPGHRMSRSTRPSDKILMTEIL